MTELELHWLAGWLEGEGCFGVSKRRSSSLHFYVSVNTTDRDVAERAASLLKVNVRPQKPKTYGLSKKPLYHLSLGRMTEAISLMRQLLPIMGERRSAKIRSLLSLYENYRPMTRFECGTARMKRLRPIMEESAKQIEAMRGAGMSLQKIGDALGLSHSAVGHRLYKYSQTYIQQLPAQLKNRAKTHCNYGHPLAGDNLEIRLSASGGMVRNCVTCQRRRNREYARRKRTRKEAA